MYFFTCMFFINYRNVDDKRQTFAQIGKIFWRFKSDAIFKLKSTMKQNYFSPLFIFRIDGWIAFRNFISQFLAHNYEPHFQTSNNFDAHFGGLEWEFVIDPFQYLLRKISSNFLVNSIFSKYSHSRLWNAPKMLFFFSSTETIGKMFVPDSIEAAIGPMFLDVELLLWTRMYFSKSSTRLNCEKKREKEDDYKTR